jgi:hypothetical protein
MEKYLFTDGTNQIREVQSGGELQAFIKDAPDVNNIRVWVYKSGEWLSYQEFLHRYPPLPNPVFSVPPTIRDAGSVKIKKGVQRPAKRNRSAGIVKFLTVAATVVTILLVYNFSRVKWYTASSMEITAARPANTPLMNFDSLVKAIESTRSQKLDKVTLTNLRLRNTWPDRVALSLKADRDTGKQGTRFHNIEITIDNSTGYNIDNAVVEVRDWRHQYTNNIDTFHFANVGYSGLSGRVLPVEYFGDSLSVSFLSLRSAGFNFCYTADKESNYGNLNDRWFCRD